MINHSSSLFRVDSSVGAVSAPLRRADWRFLLPSPPGGVFEHLVLLGGSAGLAAQIGDIGLARRVSGELPRERAADAVVVLSDAGADIPELAASLKPGGVLYREIDRLSPRMLATTPARLRRSMLRAGLSPAGAYWAMPDFATRQRYVPLDRAGAVAWYMRIAFAATSPRLQGVERLLRVLARLGSPAIGSLIRCYAGVAVAGPAAGTAPSVLGHPALPSELRQPDLRPLLITGGADDVHRIIMLPFTKHGRQPAAAIKMARLPEFNRDTVSEQAILSQVRSNLDPLLAQSLPRPLALFRHGKLVVGVESYLPGRSLSSLVGSGDVPLRRKIAFLHRVTAWLIQFHQRAQIRRLQWGCAEIERWVTQPLAAYSYLLGTTSAEARLGAAVRARAKELTGASLPLVWQHHNFGEWNILRAGDTINVIDWEHARAGLSLYDLLHFVTQWSFSARRLNGEAAQLRGFRELYCDAAPIDESILAARTAIAMYMENLGIDRGFLPLLLVYASLEKAVAYAEAQPAAGHAARDGRAGNRSVADIGILAEHADQIFGDTAMETRCVS
jgi:aminoglycoside phosphotransferase (APT) family kinase protein